MNERLGVGIENTCNWRREESHRVDSIKGHFSWNEKESQPKKFVCHISGSPPKVFASLLPLSKRLSNLLIKCATEFRDHLSTKNQILNDTKNGIRTIFARDSAQCPIISFLMMINDSVDQSIVRRRFDILIFDW